MTIYRGFEGLVKNGTKTIAQVRNWTIEQSANTEDASVLGDSWQRHIVLLKSWTGSATAFWDDSDTQGQADLVIGNAFTFQVYPNSGSSYFSGQALVTGLSTSSEVNGAVEANFTFQGNGELKIITQGKKAS